MCHGEICSNKEDDGDGMTVTELLTKTAKLLKILSALSLVYGALWLLPHPSKTGMRYCFQFGL